MTLDHEDIDELPPAIAEACEAWGIDCARVPEDDEERHGGRWTVMLWPEEVGEMSNLKHTGSTVQWRCHPVSAVVDHSHHIAHELGHAVGRLGHTASGTVMDRQPRHLITEDWQRGAVQDGVARLAGCP